METRFCSDALKETSFLMHDVELPGKNTKGELNHNTVGYLNSVNGWCCARHNTGGGAVDRLEDICTRTVGQYRQENRVVSSASTGNPRLVAGCSKGRGR